MHMFYAVTLMTTLYVFSLPLCVSLLFFHLCKERKDLILLCFVSKYVHLSKKTFSHFLYFAFVRPLILTCLLHLICSISMDLGCHFNYLERTTHFPNLNKALTSLYGHELKLNIFKNKI